MENNCCANNRKIRGFLSGIIYGLLPHSFCIGFIIFSIIGATWAAAIFKKFMLVPYFIEILIVVSFLMATFSAFLYLKRNNCLCGSGIKSKWKYLVVLYGITIFTNLFMFSYVLPALANMNSGNTDNISVDDEHLENISLMTQIPCSGHAPLIIDELKKDDGVKSVKFKNPNVFEIKYAANKTSPEKILSLEIFKTYKATIN